MSEAIIGTPLPLTCPTAPTSAACVSGYVYYDGAPVAGASVTLDSLYGTLLVTTTTGALSNMPYFQANLSNPPLLAPVGSVITLTANYFGSAASLSHVVTSGGQQADAVIRGNSMFGDGRDGSLTIAAGQIHYTDGTRTPLAISAASGQRDLQVTNSSGFALGDEVLVIQMQGVGAGNYDVGRILSLNGATLSLHRSLTYAYMADSNSKAQVLRLPHYHNLEVQNLGVVTAHTWDGNTGGVVAFRANGTALVALGGSIDVAGKGFIGGVTSGSTAAEQGDSPTGIGSHHTAANGTGGGGGALGDGAAAGGGGGGGHAIAGSNGGPGARGAGGGGGIGGTADLSALLFGGAGGGGGTRTGSSSVGGAGGASGGIVYIGALALTLDGSSLVTSIGNPGSSFSGSGSSGGGGGGAGGSILMQVGSATLGTSFLTATGGSGGLGGASGNTNDGGAGGDGRIHIQYCDSISGSSNPPSSSSQVVCPRAPIVTINSILLTTSGQNSTVTFRGSAASPSLAQPLISTYVWRSDVAGLLSDQPVFTLTAGSITPGLHTIFFKARDNNNVWSEEISRTLTILNPDSTSPVFLPLVARIQPSYFEGPFEVEDNDTPQQANGPLRSGQTYQGYQNDTNDYFSFVASAAGPVTVELTNVSAPEQASQLQLFYQTTGNLVAYRASAPYSLALAGQPGIYYVRIVTTVDLNSSSPYSLRVTFP